MRKYCMWFWRWYWQKKGYQPLALGLKRDWKVGMQGSLDMIGPFIVKGLDPEGDRIWIQFTRRHNDGNKA